MLTNNDINIRDPFVLLYKGKYYLYGTRGPTCWGKADGFDCYVGYDLEHWEDPIEVFHNDGTFWADRNYWAPEIHEYQGQFYLFATFSKEGKCKGTQILKSPSPKGPFVVHSNGPITPKDWECLDGTLYINKEGRPYMVFCHEWQQIGDGTICYVSLSKDLKMAIGVPSVMFSASQAQGVVRIRNGDNYVTDGPFLHRLSDGTLCLLWSSFGEGGYIQLVSYSDNGDVTGNWRHDPKLLNEKDGGHGMVFADSSGDMRYTLHKPNTTLKERPVFYHVKEENRRLVIY
ncbi:MAG: glycoside hydrolase family 43 protein [Lachnospiraceae bacterium]